MVRTKSLQTGEFTDEREAQGGSEMIPTPHSGAFSHMPSLARAGANGVLKSWARRANRSHYGPDDDAGPVRLRESRPRREAAFDRDALGRDPVRRKHRLIITNRHAKDRLARTRRPHTSLPAVTVEPLVTASWERSETVMSPKEEGDAITHCARCTHFHEKGVG
jgi:hypothetical protein